VKYKKPRKPKDFQKAKKKTKGLKKKTKEPQVGAKNPRS